MNIAILNISTGLPQYIHEMLQLWGLRGQRLMPPVDLLKLDPASTPVLICPAGAAAEPHTAAIADYARRGGNVIAILPGAALATAAGTERADDLTLPLRLRLSVLPLAGTAGDLLPVVSTAALYKPGPQTTVLAHLSRLGHAADLGPGLLQSPLGSGRLLIIPFDLPLSVLLCRQGDPAKAETFPSTIRPDDAGARAVHMAVDLGGEDPAWLPHADLMSRLFVELVRACLPAPSPMLWHLPNGAPAMVVYSGDEDGAPPQGTRDQMASVAAAEGRMNLYMIPSTTKATPADIAHFRAHHDLGAHPNLRPLDGKPMRERLDDFVRQIRDFEALAGVRTRSLRNHCVVWVGYMEMAEEMERLGIRMDGNFNYGGYARVRDPGPYVGWGSAMPMRFCRTDGRLIDVRQQHTHLGDDETFCNLPGHTYTYSLSPPVYAAMVRRILGDSSHRFHVPYAVNIHPGNWIRFSGGHSDALLHEARQRALPVWSFDQWSTFTDGRDAWTMEDCRWEGRTLRWRWAGPAEVAKGRQLCGVLPLEWKGGRLQALTINGSPAEFYEVTRFNEAMAMFALPEGCDAAEFVAEYTEPRVLA